MVALTCTVYDHMLTFNTELKYIWTRPISLLKVLFLYDRYVVELAIMFIVYSKYRFESHCRPIRIDTNHHPALNSTKPFAASITAVRRSISSYHAYHIEA